MEPCCSARAGNELLGTQPCEVETCQKASKTHDQIDCTRHATTTKTQRWEASCCCFCGPLHHPRSKQRSRHADLPSAESGPTCSQRRRPSHVRQGRESTDMQKLCRAVSMPFDVPCEPAFVLHQEAPHGRAMCGCCNVWPWAETRQNGIHLRSQTTTMRRTDAARSRVHLRTANAKASCCCSPPLAGSPPAVPARWHPAASPLCCQQQTICR